jgi:hypothetical protein
VYPCTSRRFFRIFSTLGQVTCLLVILGIALEKLRSPRPDRPAALNPPQELVILTVSSVPIVKDLRPSPFEDAGTIRAEEPIVTDIDNVLPLIRKGLDAYPSSFIARRNVRKIKLCKNLKLDGEPYAALAHFGSASVYIDVTLFLDRGDYLLSTFHHEIFHILDKELLSGRSWEPSWESLNRKDFSYGPAPASMRRSPSAAAEDDSAGGFLNKYSTSDPMEDRAEVFSFMMTKPDYLKVRLRTDAVLRVKVKRIAEMLNWLCPDINELFWKTRGLSVPD